MARSSSPRRPTPRATRCWGCELPKPPPAAGSSSLTLLPLGSVGSSRRCLCHGQPRGRALFGRILGSGPALVDVWESLDQYGVVECLLPEWKRVRHLAPQSAVHRFTVDRHLVETCAEMRPFLDQVDRSDLLVTAALLHDIGKGDDGDHSEIGELVAADIAGRMGFGATDVAVVARLVRHHLLLVEVATSQSPDSSDRATLGVPAWGRTNVS